MEDGIIAGAGIRTIYESYEAGETMLTPEADLSILHSLKVHSARNGYSLFGLLNPEAIDFLREHGDEVVCLGKGYQNGSMYVIRALNELSGKGAITASDLEKCVSGMAKK